MSDSWVVIIPDASGGPVAYGPIEDGNTACRFAAFLRDEVDPAVVVKLRSPLLELLTFRDNERRHDLAGTLRNTDNWPPQHGDIWQDRAGARWCCQRNGILASLVDQRSDSAAEVFRRYGPLTLVYRPDPAEVECPF